jgi:NTE family protein
MYWNLFGRKKIGLVLGGGVARGIAHIGVLKVVEKYQIPVHCLAATSSGAMVGAVYAAGLNIDLIEEIALRISWGRIVKIAFGRPGFISGEGLRDLMIKYIGDKKFDELKIPLALIAADIKTGEPVIIQKGNVARAVAASAAFPGVFTPEEIEHQTVVDGGLALNLPVEVPREMGANFVVAVDVVPAKPIHYIPHDAYQVFGRSLDLVLHQLSIAQRKRADILIEPQIDEDIWQLDLHKAKKLIAAGENAALKALRKLRVSC